MDLNFSPYTLFFGFIFGVIGYAAWRYGRSHSSERHLVLAVLLIGFSYFIPNVWLILIVGACLTFLLFYP